MRAKPRPDPSAVVAYVRVSTDEQALGPEAQRAAVERWCASSGARLVAVCSDLGVSGAAPLESRPGLLAALDALREHRAGVLLVAKRDRLARDVVVAAMVERLAERQGARVLAADGTGNGEGPEAQLLRGVVDVFAQYERALIRTRTKAALRVKRERGERVGQVPFGYRVADDGRALVEDADEQRAVARVRELRSAGLTVAEVAERLASEGHRPRGARWHATSVARIARRAAA